MCVLLRTRYILFLVQIYWSNFWNGMFILHNILMFFKILLSLHINQSTFDYLQMWSFVGSCFISKLILKTYLFIIFSKLLCLNFTMNTVLYISDPKIHHGRCSVTSDIYFFEHIIYSICSRSTPNVSINHKFVSPLIITVYSYSNVCQSILLSQDFIHS